MEHTVDIRRTTNELPEVPDAFHLRCSCGWTSSATSESDARIVEAEHLALGIPAPAPSTISPD